jgi:hypothetical protein
MSNNVVAFVGDSTIAGTGWNPTDIFADCPDANELWVNQCHLNINKLKDLELINLAAQGASNNDIFIQAVDALSKYDVKYLFCGWAPIQRYKFSAGFELYDTTVSFGGRFWKLFKDAKISLNDFEYSANEVKNLTEKLRAMHHPHYEIVKIVKYVNLLNALAAKHGTTILHINAICPWDENFFNFIANAQFPSEYTKYTQEILNVSNRDDDEIFKLYKKMHDDYANAGGIDKDRWLNLYQPLLPNMLIDTNYDDTHAGIETNKRFYEFIQEQFEAYKEHNER